MLYGRAQLEINLCHDYLSQAKIIIEELQGIAGKTKFVTRSVRLLGWGIACYVIFRMTSSEGKLVDLESFVPSLVFSIMKQLAFPYSFVVGCISSCYMCLARPYPSRAYNLRINLEEYKLKYGILSIKLKNLQQRLSCCCTEN